MRVLLLGGTTEASELAHALAAACIDAVFSYAGRTRVQLTQPLPTRVGGFGGVAGLITYLEDNAITHVIDATHPFAAQMSSNAVDACTQASVPLMALERPIWQRGPGDDWQLAADIDAAVAMLPNDPARVFLAIGKQTLAPFAARPQHVYLLRIVDRPTTPLAILNAEVVLARGPFTIDGDMALLKRHQITHVVAKNAGGGGARAKIDAARMLGLPVIMIERPALPERPSVRSVADVMTWLRHLSLLGV